MKTSARDVLSDHLAEHRPPFPVDIGNPMVLVDRLDAGMSPLRDLWNQLRGSWIAEVDPTPAWSSRSCSAEPSILPRTVPPLDRGIDVGKLDPSPLVATDRDAASHFEPAGIEAMSVSLETAAVTAGQAERADPPNRLGDFGVDLLDFGFDLGPGRGLEPRPDMVEFGLLTPHHGLCSEPFSRSSRATISSMVNS